MTINMTFDIMLGEFIYKLAIKVMFCNVDVEFAFLIKYGLQLFSTLRNPLIFAPLYFPSLIFV